MNAHDVQRLLTAAGYYNGKIDGKIGDKSLAGIASILSRRASECTSDPARWSAQRRQIGAGQLILKHAGYDPGPIDGYAGNLTRGALLEWDTVRTTGAKLVLPREPISPPVRSAFPTQAGCNAFYGTPGTTALTSQLVMYTLPVAMRIDWNLSQKSTRVQLHRKCGSSAMSAMEAVVRHYGEAEWRRLGLDRNAGTYVHRVMRGGSSWSMHAYGCAWDFYAAPNGLSMRCPQALFCKAEYKAFFDIWEAHGWTSLGRAIGRDWMHVQAARL